MANLLKGIAGVLRRAARRGVPTTRPAPATPPRSVPTASRGRRLEYAPDLDGAADPGEIVWTWVPYEDDPRQGKDRPVLVVGRAGRTLLGLMLSSQSERDGQRGWFALGPGDWDVTARPSWVRLDRVLEVDEDGIRREGAVLDRGRYDRVADRLRREYGWA
ncbi:PemK-like, MazF-like toxin of type II toxin-antitoxin system [Krasilnikovia cinnamomea]|uniref:PemK-like, MazF-like toxin of type II toxin-antitoxin system n=1 Tax=Krasilnikovia cinnamomea TaxID=349313 RepID=A0A4Q7ZFW9_9ACTN|nr:type II toxin-antitoxin system PemK/MazF family toxin [Krasilnikovia cinnamomea]RZU48899.1 PemK-like, MazF-like toxin of type II toxin-antitoxin system [Krasilnikovia cinnamomea]